MASVLQSLEESKFVRLSKTSDERFQPLPTMSVEIANLIRQSYRPIIHHADWCRTCITAKFDNHEITKLLVAPLSKQGMTHDESRED